MDNEVHIFSKGISPKVNVIIRLEFELASHEVAVQYISHDTTETPSKKFLHTFVRYWIFLSLYR